MPPFESVLAGVTLRLSQRRSLKLGLCAWHAMGRAAMASSLSPREAASLLAGYLERMAYFNVKVGETEVYDTLLLHIEEHPTTASMPSAAGDPPLLALPHVARAADDFTTGEVSDAVLVAA